MVLANAVYVYYKVATDLHCELRVRYPTPMHLSPHSYKRATQQNCVH